MRYGGELYFDDGDVIEIRSFIIREEFAPPELAFDIVATWSGLGRWRRIGISKKMAGTFTSDFGPSYQVETREEGVPCKLSFAITDVDSEFVSVEGKWVEDGESYSFSGDLQVIR
ncbi:MAG TPA: hypothetical protein VHN38_04885 [Immundisolibacter sp.]|nr:hypothetical protein [Immundisolibacter sp.]